MLNETFSVIFKHCVLVENPLESEKKLDHHFFDYISVISSIWTMENDLLKSVGVASDPFDIGQIPIYSILSIGHGMNCIPTTSMSKLFVCPSFWAEERIKRELTAMMLFGQLLNVKMTTSMERPFFTSHERSGILFMLEQHFSKLYDRVFGKFHSSEKLGLVRFIKSSKLFWKSLKSSLKV